MVNRPPQDLIEAEAEASRRDNKVNIYLITSLVGVGQIYRGTSLTKT
jgi:hypothetical protein